MRFWDAKGQVLKDQSVFANDNQYQFVVKVSSLWTGQKGFGLAFDIQDLQLFQASCPFKP